MKTPDGIKILRAVVEGLELDYSVGIDFEAGCEAYRAENADSMIVLIKGKNEWILSGDLTIEQGNVARSIAGRKGYDVVFQLCRP